MDTRNTRLIALVIAAATVLSAGSFAAADQPNRTLTPAVKVRFGDLNPQTPAGIEALYDRIRTAAATVCGTASIADLNGYWATKSCYRATLDHAVAQIRLPMLTALHESKTRKSSAGANIAANH
jgi:UrcA family protein